MQLYN